MDRARYGSVMTMATRSSAVFETVIGWCGIAWGANGIVGVQLPEATEAQTRTRMARRFHATREEAPPADVRRAIDGIVAQLRGEATDFSTVELDMDGVPAFHQRIYDVARAIAPGVTMTYGDIAMRLEAPRTAQTVGRALARNPFPIIVPCHRVLAAGGKAGGFSAPGGVGTKLRILAIEGLRMPTSEQSRKTGRPASDQLELGALGLPSP